MTRLGLRSRRDPLVRLAALPTFGQAPRDATELSRPPSPIEFVLALAGFTLASAAALLAICGAKLLPGTEEARRDELRSPTTKQRDGE